MSEFSTKAIFYDLDNTLYPQILDIEQRVRFCISFFSLPKEVEIFWMEEWVENGPQKTNIIDKVIEKFSIKIPKEKIITAYRTYRTDIKLDKQVMNLLLSLKNKGIKQFLVTNGNVEVQTAKIESLCLDSILDDIFIVSKENAKPSPYAFTKLLLKYKLYPYHCLSIGDWYQVDGIASERANLTFIHVKGGPIKEYIPTQIVSLERITEIIHLIKLEL